MARLIMSVEVGWTPMLTVPGFSRISAISSSMLEKRLSFEVAMMEVPISLRFTG